VPRHSSVFNAAPRAVLDCTSYADANALHRRITGKGLSRQSWGLRAKILEVEGFIRRQPGLTVIEVHPEVSFKALRGAPLDHPKKTPDGEALRRRLLADAGISIPGRLPEPVHRTPADDILDAGIAAWTALRFAAGDAEILGDSPPGPHATDRSVIWY
jgi:predicted RNase H-like nuclease